MKENHNARHSENINSGAAKFGKGNLARKVLLKNKKLASEIFLLWKKEKNKLKISDFVAQKYSLLLSNDQINAIINKGRRLEKILRHELK